MPKSLESLKGCFGNGNLFLQTYTDIYCLVSIIYDLTLYAKKYKMHVTIIDNLHKLKYIILELPKHRH